MRASLDLLCMSSLLRRRSFTSHLDHRCSNVNRSVVSVAIQPSVRRGLFDFKLRKSSFEAVKVRALFAVQQTPRAQPDTGGNAR